VFWAYDIGTLPLAVDEMLERAGSMQLVVRSYTSSFRKGPQAIHEVFQTDGGALASRVRMLQIVEMHGRKVVDSIFPSTNVYIFPVLDTLEVHANRYSWPKSSLTFINAPRLRTAHLFDMFAFFKLATLSHLSIMQHSYSGSYSIFPQDFMLVVSRLKGTLTTLELAFCTPNYGDRTYPTHLPNLHHLKVTQNVASLDTIGTFLRSMILPKTALLEIHIEMEKALEDCFNTLNLFLQVVMQGVGDPILDGVLVANTSDSLLITFTAAKYYPAEAMPSLDPFDSMARVQRLSFCFKFRHITPAGHLKLLSTFVHALPNAAQIQTMSFKCNEMLKSPEQLLRPFPNVRNFRIIDSQALAANVFDALCSDPSGSGSTNLLMPSLENLWLVQGPHEKPLYTQLLKRIQARGIALRIFWRDERKQQDILIDPHLYT